MFERIREAFRRTEDPTIAALSSVPFFMDLRKWELRQVAEVLQHQSYVEDEPVFEQGDSGVGMYVVLSGRVDVFHTDEEDGSRQWLAEVKQGSFFGEMSLLDDAPRTALAIAREETELGILYRADLLGLAEHRAHLGVKIVMSLSQVVAERLRRTNHSLKEVRDELQALQEAAKSHDPSEGEPA